MSEGIVRLIQTELKRQRLSLRFFWFGLVWFFSPLPYFCDKIFANRQSKGVRACWDLMVGRAIVHHGGKTWRRDGEMLVTCHLQGSLPRDPLPPPKGSTVSQTVTTCWGLSVQTHSLWRTSHVGTTRHHYGSS